MEITGVEWLKQIANGQVDHLNGGRGGWTIPLPVEHSLY